jgi:DNA helicase TIP49 (TBP-interacting protein)
VLDVLEVSESHTAEVCARTFENVAIEWEIAEKVMVIVTDRGRNIVKGVEQHTPFLNTNCLANILQRGIAAGLKASGMEGLLVKCRKIVGHFKPGA